MSELWSGISGSSCSFSFDQTRFEEKFVDMHQSPYSANTGPMQPSESWSSPSVTMRVDPPQQNEISHVLAVLAVLRMCNGVSNVAEDFGTNNALESRIGKYYRPDILDALAGLPVLGYLPSSFDGHAGIRKPKEANKVIQHPVS